MKTIPLTLGMVALVDDEDYESLIGFRWYALFNSITRSYYAVRNSGTANGARNYPIAMHRQILGLTYGDPRRADHIRNGETLDNRRANLRICTPSENAANSRPHRDNKSGFKGVSWGTKDKKWVVQINRDGRRVFRRGFSNLKDAAQVYALKHYLLFGEFSGTQIALA